MSNLDPWIPLLYILPLTIKIKWHAALSSTMDTSFSLIFSWNKHDTLHVSSFPMSVPVLFQTTIHATLYCMNLQSGRGTCCSSNEVSKQARVLSSQQLIP